MRLLYWALGFSVWLPATALAVVGTFGIQPASVAAMAIVSLRILNGRLSIDTAVSGVMLIWLVGMLASALFAPDIAAALRFIVIYLTGMLCLVAAYESGTDSRISSVKGFFVGGVVSAVYSVYQQLAFDQGLPMPLALNNNPAMSSYAQNLMEGRWGTYVNRAFAFTPEPSVLAAILLACLMAAIGEMMSENRRIALPWLWVVILTISAGMIACGSLGLFISLPITIAGFILVISLLFRRSASVKRLGKKMATLIAVISSVLLMVYFFGLFNTAVMNSVMERLSDIGFSTNTYSVGDASTAVRLASILHALDIFLENPVFGYGVFVDAGYFSQGFPLRSLEMKTGVDSWPLSILAGGGIISFTGYLLLVGLTLSRARRSPFLLALFIGTLLPTLAQSGYIMLYHVWFAWGLCCSRSRVSTHAKIQRAAKLSAPIAHHARYGSPF